MKITPTRIEGLLLIQLPVFTDERGFFLETYNLKSFQENGLPYHFVQDNLSCSSKNVLRGLHFQNPPFGQGKLVRVLRGSVLDVAVDLRKSSPTYGQHELVELSDKNSLAFYIPEGFAHGFLALEENTLFQYKCTNYYHKASEGGLLWDDPDLGINWGAANPLVSEKDKIYPPFMAFDSLFT